MIRYSAKNSTFNKKNLQPYTLKKIISKYEGYRAITIILLVLVSVCFNGCNNLAVLHPKGDIGEEEVFLIRVAFLLMLIVVVPVIILAFWFPIKYRAKNKKATYMPDWGKSIRIEWLVWLVPIAIIIVLSYLTWVKTYQLDPYKPVTGKNEPIQIEVVSLDWKWLFIYPDHNIATVNQLVFPENTPLEFRLTSASVMTSFFIPQLGSQMYAMAGMQTQLNLITADTGTFVGQNQEFSGVGYETMFFKAKSVTGAEFNSWVKQVKKSTNKLDLNTFNNLVKPSVGHSVICFSSIKPGLFDWLIMEFMNNNGKMRLGS